MDHRVSALRAGPVMTEEFNRQDTNPAVGAAVHDAAGSPVARDPTLRDHASAADERRLALLHEGAAALDEVLAVEAALDQLGAAREVALAFVGHRLVGDELDRVDGERRVAPDRVGV